MKTIIALLTITCSYIFISSPCEQATEDDKYIDMLTYVQEITDTHPRCQHLATLVLLGRHSEISSADETKYGQCYRGVARAVRLN